jgi:hypothetical protein
VRVQLVRSGPADGCFLPERTMLEDMWVDIDGRCICESDIQAFWGCCLVIAVGTNAAVSMGTVDICWQAMS